MDQMSGALSQGALRWHPKSIFDWQVAGVAQRGVWKLDNLWGRKWINHCFPIFYFYFWGALKGDLRGKQWVGSFFHHFAVNIYLKASPEHLTRDSGWQGAPPGMKKRQESIGGCGVRGSFRKGGREKGKEERKRGGNSLLTAAFLKFFFFFCNLEIQLCPPHYAAYCLSLVFSTWHLLHRQSAKTVCFLSVFTIKRDSRSCIPHQATSHTVYWLFCCIATIISDDNLSFLSHGSGSFWVLNTLVCYIYTVILSTQFTEGPSPSLQVRHATAAAINYVIITDLLNLTTAK